MMPNEDVGSRPVALVTGATGGLGQAIVRRLIDDGYHVFGADITEGTSDVSAGWRYIRADITSETDVRTLFDVIRAEAGRVDLVVNNAAVQIPGDLLATAADDFRTVLDVNVVGPFLVAQSAVAAMLEAGSGGAIVNVSSVLGLVADGDLLAYTTSKSAVLGLTRSIAVVYAKDRIRCNAVCPGDIDTSMSAEYSLFVGQSPTAISAHYPRGSIALPSEVADAIAYLGSDRATAITGQTLVVDGGLLAKCY